MADLRDCARHWGDLDEMIQGDLHHLPDLPEDVRRVMGDINDLYPARKRRAP